MLSLGVVQKNINVDAKNVEKNFKKFVKNLELEKLVSTLFLVSRV